MSHAAASAEAYRYTFTVFTPTYNRINTLPRVYESLKNQTFRDFEWLIVDDGSTDGTASLVESWQAEATFPIRYLWQENCGKLVAISRGVRNAQGELFLTLDSDDACFPQALERFKYHWDSIPEEERLRFSAVTALCVDEHGAVIGSKFPRDVTDSDSIEIRYRFKVMGDKWGFQRTDVLKQFPFPAVEGETFIPESVLWGAIAREYRTRFVNEPLLVVFRGEDGLSEPHLAGWASATKHSVGMTLWHEAILNHDIVWFRYAPTAFFLSAAHYTRFSLHSGRGLAAQAARLEGPMSRTLWLLMVPFGWLIYLRDRWQMRNAGARARVQSL